MPVYVFGPTDLHPRVAYTHDITRGGARMEFYESLPPARQLSVQVSAGRRLRAVVRWIIDGGPHGRRLVGCEFPTIQA
jgi:hypothetical protein